MIYDITYGVVIVFKSSTERHNLRLKCVLFENKLYQIYLT